MVSAAEEKARYLRDALETMNVQRIGKSISWHEHVDSTNLQAANLAKEGAEEGMVVLSDVQDAGYGRLNRSWASPAGGVWLSIILRPKIAIQEAAKITLMGGVAVAETLESLYGLNPTIKWPNDVLISEKKVCGILTEMRTEGRDIQFLILGLGINANCNFEELPEDIRSSATTLRLEKGSDISIMPLIETLLYNIDRLYNVLLSGDTRYIINLWKNRSDTLGRRVAITTPMEKIEGLAMDLDDSGALVIRTDDGGLKTIVAGDCTHLTNAI
ncbi:MAG: biotin--[acetyl-CoA-carboxylase] ligase [Thermoplasmata archaeon]|nr:MAG: biotin--[acetyl-CoA-carboxylase] ligase [Thermoplasmata archaeon]